jgi:hypothetical protein
MHVAATTRITSCDASTKQRVTARAVLCRWLMQFSGAYSMDSSALSKIHWLKLCWLLTFGGTQGSAAAVTAVSVELYWRMHDSLPRLSPPDTLHCCHFLSVVQMAMQQL